MREVKEMIDVASPHYVEVVVSNGGTTVWVNVDGLCRFRATRIEQIILNDERQVHKEVRTGPQLRAAPAPDRG